MRGLCAGIVMSVVVMAMPSAAQRMGGSFRSSGGFRQGPHARFPQAIYVGSPFWGDDYFPRDPAAPSVIVIQQPAPAASQAKAIEEAKPAEPLLIEWQGDHFVRRIGGSSGLTVAGTPEQSTSKKASAAQPARFSEPTAAVPTARAESAPTTFVFRDGHQEQSSDYTIASGMIYARGDYWTSGSWTKKIPIAQLDIPATLRANADKGVPFRLPSAPNEVITRP
jgi:hypothetical protein